MNEESRWFLCMILFGCSIWVIDEEFIQTDDEKHAQITIDDSKLTYIYNGVELDCVNLSSGYRDNYTCDWIKYHSEKQPNKALD